jgi:hypothetical protein
MNRALAWALALDALSLAAVMIARLFAAPHLGAIVAGVLAPGIVIAMYEILRALDGPRDDPRRRSAYLAGALLAVPFVILLSFARLLGVQALP